MALPELVAHRGYRLRYPENTLAAVAAAIDAGARFVEVDIQLTRDRVPILFHDASLKRICGVDGAVKDHTLEELKRLHASEFDRFGYRYATLTLGTLAELVGLLKRHPGVTAFIELKHESLAHFGISEVLTAVLPALAEIRTRAVLISYEHDAMLAARRGGWPNVGVVLERWRDRNSAVVQAIAPEYVFADVDDLPRVGRLRVGEAKLVIFEVTDAKLALRLAKRGVQFIETFAIAELKRDLSAAR